ncbi:Desmoglein-3 [Myotis brandtii]|uniref:Desmoglein-3 n=1 Tax=Myotis brandtii TaxID=109478 RepID=S7P343_MYOBR|nr:Desmoglein-3 [Myotis brandtii]
MLHLYSEFPYNIYDHFTQKGSLRHSFIQKDIQNDVQKTKGQPGENGTAVQGRRRHKREWVKFARPCREEEDNSKRNPIAQISSDFHAKQKITYRITGIGIDQPPLGIFVVDRNTGDINITAIVDREQTPNFHITCHALNALGQEVEKPLILTVKILDINDNPPVFSQSVFMGEIEENSPANSLVMILNATDADEPNHLNSKIAFKIVSQEPAGIPMFLMSRHSGEVRTLTSSLDREQVSSYRLIVSGADRDGEGLSSQCESSIKVKDVNDNFPMFKESQYSVRIEENTLSSELLRFQVIDLDEEFTDNWLAEYFFTSGNEGNWFEIQTDARTNEGILKVVKPLDYEQLQNAQFSIAVKNKAEFHQSVISQYRVQSTQVKVQVINVREGIAFRPASKTFTVQKGISRKKLINYILGTYAAIDEDTGKPASNVRYALGRNDGGFLIIDSKTAQIKFARNMVRDSTFIFNRTIIAEVLAIDENTGKTSTGTIYVEVPGFNENCPTTVLEKEMICSSSPSVVVSARAQDSDRYTGPYTFSLEDESVKLPIVWRITTVNATSALLTTQQQLPPGRYPISLVIADRQDRQCDTPEGLAVEVCQCDNRDTCTDPQPGPRYGDQPSGRLGPNAIGLILLGLLLLLLAPLLLLTCDCGKGPIGGATTGFIPVPEGSEGTIHQWGIEGAQPEDKKAFACAEEDDGQEANDCLLIYDNEGLGAPSSPVGSLGCCSFIADDLDESFLDSLGPKFKQLAEISLGLDGKGQQSQLPTQSSGSGTGACGHSVEIQHSELSGGQTTSGGQGACAWSASGSVLQPAICIPDPLQQGGYLVTETYSASGSLAQPPTAALDPLLMQNVVMTERVICPIASGHGHLHGAAELRGSCNMIYTEDPCSRLI